LPNEAHQLVLAHGNRLGAAVLGALLVLVLLLTLPWPLPVRGREREGEGERERKRWRRRRCVRGWGEREG
jgi:hypothetical protein